MQASDDQEKTVKYGKMEVDQSGHGITNIKTESEPKSEDCSKAINGTQFLQSVLESLIGVNAQSKEVRHAMEARTGVIKMKNQKMVLISMQTSDDPEETVKDKNMEVD